LPETLSTTRVTPPTHTSSPTTPMRPRSWFEPRERLEATRRREVDAEALVDLVDGDLAPDEEPFVGDPDESLLAGLGDVADDLFEDVLDGEDALELGELVADDDHRDALALHLSQQVVYLAGVGNMDGVAEDVFEGQSLAGRPLDVADVDDAADLL
jgi:hypothetical protein